MSSSTCFLYRVVITVVLVTAAATAALAQQRGPVQASFETAGRTVSNPDTTQVNAREDGHSHGSHVVSADRSGHHLYIIRFQEPSLARYEGGIEGIPATSSQATGERLNTRSTAAIAYRDFLIARQADYLAQAGHFLQRSVEPQWQYTNATNGVAIRLTPGEAEQLAGLPFVVDIQVDRHRWLTTDEGPLLIQAPAIWNGQTSSGDSTQGEGVIVGVLDTGINHLHPSFAATDGDGFTHSNPFGAGNYVGVCEAANPDQVFDDICNDKLIGAWSFVNGPNSGDSARDWNNHGSHVAATAVGNRHVADVSLGGANFQLDVSGVAPRANLISYQVCDPACPDSSSLAAIDQAIADGVDVLNFSISGTDDPWTDLVDLAFLAANAAGILVAASAGNDGPGASTVANTGPWNVAVAATTHQRIFAQPVTLAGITDPVSGVPGSGPAIAIATNATLRWAGDVDSGNIRGCNSFPENAYWGEAALIEGGDCTFAEKVNNAFNAGATLVILYNHVGGPPTVASGLEGTSIPAVMISDSAGQAFIAELAGATAQVSIDPGVGIVRDENYEDVMAGFSSRGPSQFNLLAPTFAAPGVNILAAGFDGPGDYVSLQGTSMASAHAAGAAALLTAQHPDWTPTEIRSALALTATPETLTEDGVNPGNPFDHGSGRLQLGSAGRIGFVMDESIANFVVANPADGGEPADLNLASIQNSACYESCSYQRTIRSVVHQAIAYSVTSDAPAGVTITVTPSSFTLNPGAEQTLDIEIDVTGAPFEEWLLADIQIQQDLSIPTNSQYISENFSSTTFPPTGWDMVNAGAAGREWVRTADISHSGPASAFHNYDGSNAVDNWLITPRIELGDDSRLTFFERGFFMDAYQGSRVMISNGSCNPMDNDFVELLQVPDSTLDWRRFELDLSAYDNQEVCITFRYTGLFAHTWNIDTVVIEETPLVVAAAHLPVAVVSLDPKPVIALSTDSLMATQQRDQVTAQEFSIFNEGQEPLEWSLNELGPQGLTGTLDCPALFNPWTNVTPTSGTLSVGESATVSVEFYSTGMMEGSYNSAFCVVSNDEDAPVTLIPVQLNVVNLPAASVTPESAAFSVVSGLSDASQVVINNSGLGELEFVVLGADSSARGVCAPIDTIAWLSVDPESGTVAPEGGEQPVDLLVDASQVSPGNYSAIVCFETNDAQNSLLGVSVELEVMPLQSAAVSFDDLVQTYTGDPLGVTVVTDPPGLDVEVTYDGTTTPPINAGSYTVEATVTEPGFAGKASTSFVIEPATATILFDDLQQFFTGSALQPTITTDPAGLNVIVTYDGKPTAPSAVGQYLLEVEVDEQNWTSSESATFEILAPLGDEVFHDRFEQ